MGQAAPRFLNTPVASPPPETLCSLPSDLKITPRERFEKTGLVQGLRVGAAATLRAEFSLHLSQAEPTSLAFEPDRLSSSATGLKGMLAEMSKLTPGGPR